jgi:hypothetical protein
VQLRGRLGIVWLASRIARGPQTGQDDGFDLTGWMTWVEGEIEWCDGIFLRCGGISGLGTSLGIFPASFGGFLAAIGIV